MPFDLNAAMRASGNTPDMYENQKQAMQDLQAQAANDPEFRRRMVTERARNWHRGYMGQEPPPMPTAQPVPNMMQPQFNQISPAGDDGQAIRGLLAQLRQLGAIA
jgi:hypothetical protein